MRVNSDNANVMNQFIKFVLDTKDASSWMKRFLHDFYSNGSRISGWRRLFYFFIDLRNHHVRVACFLLREYR